MRQIKLPYFDERQNKIEMIVLHCLAFDVSDGIKSFRQAEVSAHYMISPKGQIYNLVDEKDRAWHAGKSFWKGRECVNHFSIGIELCSPSLGQDPYEPRQMYALMRLVKKIKRKYHIRAENILGHSDIAPVRKPDPGKAFPWKYLSRYGIGRWYNVKNAAKVSETDPKRMLLAIGYDVSDEKAALCAFCRHFAPQFVLTENNLAKLLKTPSESLNITSDEEFSDILKAVFWEYSIH